MTQQEKLAMAIGNLMLQNITLADQFENSQAQLKDTQAKLVAATNEISVLNGTHAKEDN